MLGTQDTFVYSECSDCGTLQLLNRPTSWNRYYPPADYYSLRPVLAARPGVVARLAADIVLRTKLPLGVYERLRLPRTARWFRGLGIRRSSPILDVGSGTGSVLHGMASVGFSHLHGVDPFLEESMLCPNGVRLTKGDLSDIDGRFDVVMFHHSLEHMAEPRRILEAAVARVADAGWLLIRVPVADSWAFQKYREDWVQLDAPRHQFIYTTRSLRMLAESLGLVVRDIYRDSHAVGLFGSEQYRRGIPLTVKDVFSQDEMRAFQDHARRLNRQGLGDQAVFLMQRGRV